MRRLLVLLAACTGSEGSATSSIAACDLADPAPACTAPAQSIAAGEDSKHGTALAADTTYEVSSTDGVGYLAYTATITGIHTLYFDTDGPPHVCDFHIVQPTCESALPASCAMFEDARQYAMVAGEDYELRVPNGAHIRIDAPASTEPGPQITITSAPAEGGTSGPLVSLSFEVAGDPSLDCRLDGVPGPCASMGLSTPPNLTDHLTPAGPHTYEVRAVGANGGISVATRSWTTICNPPSAAGALGVLHLDATSGQLATNGVTSAPAAILGDTTAVEASDPAWTAPGRFGRALAFTPGDHLTWPLGLGVKSGWTLELWLRPQAPAVGMQQDVLVTGDGSLTIRTLDDSGNSTFVVRVGGVFEQRVGSFTSGTWHKLLLSSDGESIRIWADDSMYERTLPSPLAVTCSGPKGSYEARANLSFGYDAPTGGAGLGTESANWKFEIK